MKKYDIKNYNITYVLVIVFSLLLLMMNFLYINVCLNGIQPPLEIEWYIPTFDIQYKLSFIGKMILLVSSVLFVAGALLLKNNRVVITVAMLISILFDVFALVDFVVSQIKFPNYAFDVCIRIIFELIAIIALNIIWIRVLKKKLDTNVFIILGACIALIFLAVEAVKFLRSKYLTITSIYIYMFRYIIFVLSGIYLKQRNAVQIKNM